jgi:hypothetical protein
MLLPEPETAKWEEQLLKASIESIKTQIDIAILASSSLGKTELQHWLEHMKRDTRFLPL